MMIVPGTPEFLYGIGEFLARPELAQPITFVVSILSIAILFAAPRLK